MLQCFQITSKSHSDSFFVKMFDTRTCDIKDRSFDVHHNYYTIHYSIFHIFRMINSQCKNGTDSLHFDSNNFLEPRPLWTST